MSNEPTSPRVSTTSTSDPARWRRLAWIGRRLLPLGIFLVAAVVLVVLVGAAQRLGWLRGGGQAAAPTSAAADTIFTCPMHPQIRQPSPGRCPICGMELVPASNAGAANADELAVHIEPAARRLANIQTASVRSEPLETSLQTIGLIAVDESRQATIAAYIAGRLERLFADYTGVVIQRGDHLAVIYSPQLFAAQVDYLEARRGARTASGIPAVREAQATLADNTRQRLGEFGMTDDQVADIERTGKAESRLTIYAPQGGTVIEKLAVEGNYVEAGDPIYRIADLSTVWLMLKLFPEDASRIRFGQRVEAVIQSLPGETFIGRVAFIDPTVDPQTRTVGVRVELLNEHGRLRPGDYAEATIALPIGAQGKVYDAGLAGKWISPMHPQIIRDEPGQCPICGMDLVPTSNYGFAEEPVTQPESLYVPRSAVLMAGGNSVVYVETVPGRFELRPVTVGPILQDRIVILSGLEPGEEVATDGNFLIDSQMQLAGKPSLIDPTRALAHAQQPDRPLSFEQLAPTPISGAAGQTLDQLYTAYFQVHEALAADQKPAPAAAQALHAAASELSEAKVLPAPATELVQIVAAESEHLHHVDLKRAREQFKPVSDAVVTLATQVRSAGAEQSFTHFFCPMVPGGGGDWLQNTDALLNPYFGSAMLRCGEKVHEFPPPAAAAAESAPAAEPAPQSHQHEGA